MRPTPRSIVASMSSRRHEDHQASHRGSTKKFKKILRGSLWLSSCPSWLPLSNARAQLLLLAMALDGELEKSIDQIGIGEAARFPHLRIHADGGEAGQRVHLVDEQLAGRARHQEVDAREPGAVDGAEGLDGHAPDVGRLLVRERSRDERLRSF